MELTQQRLKELLSYDQDTGAFVWRVQRGKALAGLVARTLNSSGHIKIGIDGYEYLAHRLAWLYVYGQMPENEIDHINGIRSDNSINNLRDVPSFVNRRNTARYSNNTTGVTGVSKAKGKYRAYIEGYGRRICLGVFLTIEEASEARKKANVDYGYTSRHGT